MEHAVKAVVSGVVTKVHSAVGELVEDGRVIVTYEGK